MWRVGCRRELRGGGSRSGVGGLVGVSVLGRGGEGTDLVFCTVGVSTYPINVGHVVGNE